jgi:hypothetical protein
MSSGGSAVSQMADRIKDGPGQSTGSNLGSNPFTPGYQGQTSQSMFGGYGAGMQGQMANAVGSNQPSQGSFGSLGSLYGGAGFAGQSLPGQSTAQATLDKNQQYQGAMGQLPTANLGSLFTGLSATQMQQPGMGPLITPPSSIPQMQSAQLQGILQNAVNQKNQPYQTPQPSPLPPLPQMQGLGSLFNGLSG